MSDPTFYLSMAATGLAGLAMLIYAALNGWRGWLQLKHQQLGLDRPEHPAAVPSAGARIEIADLKERIRKLEAIAAGVDL
ncbi:hypothetical protein K7957_02680 [Sphingomonas yunnanensis]|uniref:hypothetical protein n=1 Tax=Sphingomonas yunnanensis TaxID=310400 RepID=UPI001CA63395|nr:hypothetical protein [Sphingomonas yunnanensis]MBY9061835.1 hypothetical protein [Sphingomonas yunnanensis]